MTDRDPSTRGWVRPLRPTVIKAFLVREPRCGLRRGDRVCTMPHGHDGRVHYDLWALNRFTASQPRPPASPHLDEPTPVDWPFMASVTGPEPTHPAYRGPQYGERDPRRHLKPAARIAPKVSIDDLLDSL